MTRQHAWGNSKGWSCCRLGREDLTPRPDAICNQRTVSKGKINAASATWCEPLRHSCSRSRLSRTLSPSRPVPAPWPGVMAQHLDWMLCPTSMAGCCVPALVWVLCPSSVAGCCVPAPWLGAVSVSSLLVSKSALQPGEDWPLDSPLLNTHAVRWDDTGLRNRSLGSSPTIHACD